MDLTVGFIKSIFKKSSHPKHLTSVFAFTAMGAPMYTHHTTCEALKNIAYEGYPFHGLIFAGNHNTSKTYRQTIQIALKYMSSQDYSWAASALAEFEDIVGSDMNSSVNSHRNGVAKQLAKFWGKYNNKLHPVLQGVDPILQMASAPNDATLSGEEKSILGKYMSTMNDETTGYFVTK